MAIETLPTISASPAKGRPTESSRRVPWQVWVTVTLLGLEGVGNLLAIPGEPLAASWFATKCLFIIGLIRGWRWVFILFILVASLHVLEFSTQAPFVALLNLVIVGLVGSKYRSFFPSKTLKTKVLRTGKFDPEFDV